MGTWVPGPGATEGNDVFTGDAANETVDGLGGDDTLNGGGGDDVLIGGAGADQYFGGAGDDTIVAGHTNYNHGPETYDGGLGLDTLFASDWVFLTSAGTAFGSAPLTSIERLDFSNTSSVFGNNWLLLYPSHVSQLNAAAQALGVAVEVVGGAGARLEIGLYESGVLNLSSWVFTDWHGAVVLSGAAGNDELVGTTVSDFIFGNDGNDNLIGGAGADELTGGVGNDWLYGGLGDDRLQGGAGNDVLLGGSPVIQGFPESGGGGVDLVSGGGGDDIIYAAPGDGAAGEVFDGGAEFDELRISDGLVDLTDSSIVSIEALRFPELGLPATLVITGAQVASGFASDLLMNRHYSTQKTMIRIEDAGSGVDLSHWVIGDWYAHLDIILIVGAPGTTAITGSSVTDLVSYENSIAGLVASLADSSLNTGDAAGDSYISIEQLNGGLGADVLYGDGARNGLFGNDGNDVLFGGAADDFLLGGLGDDTFEGQAGGDYFDGGPGINTAAYTTAPSGVIAFMVSNQFNAGDAAGDIFFSIQNLIGSAHADILGGTVPNNVIDGGDGDDWLFGNPGDDTLLGGNGNDLLNGEAGADAMDGQSGDDVASYRYASAGVAASLLTGGTGGEAAGDTFVNIENIWASDFDDDVAGDNGDNQVYGFAGADILAGNGGDDDFYGAEGGDTITGGAGADDFYFLDATQGGDTITDYNAGDGDRLLFSQYWFGIILGGFQTLPTANLVSNNAPAANAATPQFLWDSDDRVLYFDADGTGAGAAVTMASFTNGVNLTAGDIWMA